MKLTSLPQTKMAKTFLAFSVIFGAIFTFDTHVRVEPLNRQIELLKLQLDEAKQRTETYSFEAKPSPHQKQFFNVLNTTAISSFEPVPFDGMKFRVTRFGISTVEFAIEGSASNNGNVILVRDAKPGDYVELPGIGWTHVVKIVGITDSKVEINVLKYLNRT